MPRDEINGEHVEMSAFRRKGSTSPKQLWGPAPPGPKGIRIVSLRKGASFNDTLLKLSGLFHFLIQWLASSQIPIENLLDLRNCLLQALPLNKTGKGSSFNMFSTQILPFQYHLWFWTKNHEPRNTICAVYSTMFFHAKEIQTQDFCRIWIFKLKGPCRSFANEGPRSLPTS